MKEPVAETNNVLVADSTEYARVDRHCSKVSYITREADAMGVCCSIHSVFQISVPDGEQCELLRPSFPFNIGGFINEDNCNLEEEGGSCTLSGERIFIVPLDGACQDIDGEGCYGNESFISFGKCAPDGCVDGEFDIDNNNFSGLVDAERNVLDLLTPSQMPSTTPTVSSYPSVGPSSSLAPSSTPSASSSPSSLPSSHPSASRSTSTDVPSAKPSLRPSDVPQSPPPASTNAGGLSPGTVAWISVLGSLATIVGTVVAIFVCVRDGRQNEEGNADSERSRVSSRGDESNIDDDHDDGQGSSNHINEATSGSIVADQQMHTAEASVMASQIAAEEENSVSNASGSLPQ